MEQTIIAEVPKKSTHRTEVVEVKLLPCPDSDHLSLCKVGEYQCVLRTADWKDGDLAAYIVPDSIVPLSRPEFAFLSKGKEGETHHRVKAKRLRQQWSEGLLVPAPLGSKLGDDVSELLGVERYEPPEKPEMKGECEKGPNLAGYSAEAGGPLQIPVYDLESWQKYGYLFRPGEMVTISEKIHGANCRVTWWDGRLWVGSRTNWKKEFPTYDHLTVEGLMANGVEEVKAQEIVANVLARPRTQNLWWKALRQYPQVERALAANPGYVLYGEVYGQIQDLTYGAAKGEVRFAAFDLWRNGSFAGRDEFITFVSTYMVPTVPILCCCPYNAELIRTMIDGNSCAATGNKPQIREGIVIKAFEERYEEACGRMALKAVSKVYLERA